MGFSAHERDISATPPLLPLAIADGGKGVAWGLAGMRLASAPLTAALAPLWLIHDWHPPQGGAIPGADDHQQ